MPAIERQPSSEDFLKSLGFPTLSVHETFTHFDFTKPGRRVLLIGPMGSGKTEFAARVWRDAAVAQTKSDAVRALTSTGGVDRRKIFFIRSEIDGARFTDYPEDALAYRNGYIRCGDNIARIRDSFGLEQVIRDNPEVGTYIIDEASFFDERLAYESDLEKNLFQDYYCNNLMRFLSGDYRQHSCEFERDPSGQGINYKNFVEMVYLYYIASDLPAVEKIRRSAAMIERLQQSGDSSPVPPPTDVSRDTGYFKGLFFRTQSGTFLFCEDLLSQPEAQFEEFLRTNYQCGTRKGKHEVGMLQMETEQNTAFRCYQGLMKELRELLV